LVDIGANVGFLTLVGARCVGPHGRVLAVEASERIGAHLQENVARNSLTHVTVNRCAVHEEDRSLMEFYDAPVEKFGKGSLAPQYYQTPVMVPTRTLDSLAAEASLPAVDVVKVDVEGFEASVFRGAARLLEASPAPFLLFEFEDWSEVRAGCPAGRAQDVLLDKGYRLARLGDWLKDRSLLERPLRSGAAMLVGVPPSALESRL
jgi:FkbM family methyltransferase